MWRHDKIPPRLPSLDTVPLLEKKWLLISWAMFSYLLSLTLGSWSCHRTLNCWGFADSELCKTYLIKHHPYPVQQERSNQFHSRLTQGRNTFILSKEEMALEARSSQEQLGASVAGSQYLLTQNLPLKKLSFIQSVYRLSVYIGTWEVRCDWSLFVTGKIIVARTKYSSGACHSKLKRSCVTTFLNKTELAKLS